MQIPSAWRSRLPLLVVLGVLLVVNSALLVSYSVFYDDQLQGLLKNEKELQNRLAGAHRGLTKVEETGQRLGLLQKRLEDFYSQTLGSRRERLAPLIEEIYQMTRKVHLRPQRISYVETPARGASEIGFSFVVDGTYTDVKSLLAAFESSPSFLVVEGVGVALNQDQPDLLHVNLFVAHYFRQDPAQAPRRARPVLRTSGMSGGGPSR